MLLRLLEQSKEPLVLCVAAHDVGEYVRHYPHGKKYVDCLFFEKKTIHHLEQLTNSKEKLSSCVY
jgi:V-type H+-transporting ATPase subunit H